MNYSPYLLFPIDKTHYLLDHFKYTYNNDNKPTQSSVSQNN